MSSFSVSPSFFIKQNSGSSQHVALIHINVAGILVILSKEISEMMLVCGLKYFPRDFGYKLICYPQRVGRDVTLAAFAS